MSATLMTKTTPERTAKIILILDKMFLARNDGTKPEAITVMADYLTETKYAISEIAQATKELIPYVKAFGKIGIPEIAEKIREIKIRKIDAKALPEPAWKPASKEEIAIHLRKAGFGEIVDSAKRNEIKPSILNNPQALEKRKEELRQQAESLKAV